MKWKKLLPIVLGTALFLGLLAGCGSHGTSYTDTGGPAIEEADVQAIVDRGVLRVGVKNNVTGFGLQDILTNQYTGMEVDIGKMIADELGVEVEYTAVNAATRSELIDSGDLDCVVATFTITEERKTRWGFTTPYYVDATTVLVENRSGIESLADLVGTTVGVSSGSVSARSMVAAMVEAGLISESAFDASTFDASTWTEQVRFRQYDDYPAISTALAAGEVEGFCVDKSILSYYNNDNRSFIQDNFAAQEYGVVTTLGTGFARLCEELIVGWHTDGSLEALVEKHNIQ